MTEFDNMKDLQKLSDIATSISAQLLAIDNINKNNNETEEKL